MTFSIVACDLDAPSGAEWGGAVASKFLAVGSIVLWARADAGAVATQSFANPTYGPRGLDMLGTGRDARSTLDDLTGSDEEREKRQAGIVDASGSVASFTGNECFDWAGGREGRGYACQGNILTGPDVVDRMAEAFEATAGRPLAERLLAALAAGDDAGGDKRGRQGASLLVVRRGGGYLGDIDVAVDLRVDDHATPVDELKRLYSLHELYFPRPDELEFDEIDAGRAGELRDLLRRAGFEVPDGDGYTTELHDALFEFVGTENLEMRWKDEPVIERGVVRHLHDLAERAAT